MPFTVKRAKLINLKFIAERAKVSTATVSRALRNDERISAVLRQRVHQVAQELGYRPNPFISTLMKNLRNRQPLVQTATIAYITAFPTRDGWRKTPQMGFR